jgi:hypothetical protein
MGVGQKLNSNGNIINFNFYGLQLAKKSPAFYGTRRFITVVTSAHHLSIQSQPSPVHTPTFHFLKIHLNITLVGRPRFRWEENIKMDLQVVGCGFKDWIELAQDRQMAATLECGNEPAPWSKQASSKVSS